MSNGLIYNPTDPELVACRMKARTLADKFNRTKACELKKRQRLIEKIFPYHGKNPFFEPNIRVEYGFNTVFGDNFYMNFDCKLLDVAKIVIGDNVMFGPGVTIGEGAVVGARAAVFKDVEAWTVVGGNPVTVATPLHPMVAEERIAKEREDGFYDLEYAAPVKIGSNVWIAANVTVCGGVTVGDDCVIGAGSVVTRDIPSGCFAAGVPCRVKRQITEKDKIFPEKY